MKNKIFTGRDVLWGTNKESFKDIQNMLDNLIPGAKAVILPDEILNYEPTEEELSLLGLKNKNDLIIDEKDFNSEFNFKELKIDIDEKIGIILNDKVLNNQKYNEKNETKAA